MKTNSALIRAIFVLPVFFSGFRAFVLVLYDDFSTALFLLSLFNVFLCALFIVLC